MANPDDPRLGSIIREGDLGDVVIVGFPFAEGVRRNGGRVGSALGPQYFRQFLGAMGALVNREYDVDLSSISIGDAGDVEGGTLEEAHQNLRAKVRKLIQNGAIPFVVGGGNDQSYPNAAAMLDEWPDRSVAAINIDAHLDVRPKLGGLAHSGSPFRDLLEDARFDGHCFTEFGAQGGQCSAVHADYVRDHGGRIRWFSEIESSPEQAFSEELVRAASTEKKLFVSFDLDAIQGADCPGVSCPATIGISASSAMKIAFAAGLAENIKLFDLSELNPIIEAYRTPRLAVNLFYFFLLGAATRVKKRDEMRGIVEAK